MNSELDGDHAASVIIPAHNEARTIDRLLRQLSTPVNGRSLEVLVVCNGCTDETAEIARAHGVVVHEIPDASKRKALRHGDDVAHAFPRVYVDADVEISAADVLRLADAVATGGIQASAPERKIPREGVNPLVNWYYDVWESLPQVRAGLFGRGVIALSEDGNARVRALPPSMSDDLVVSEAFGSQETLVLRDAYVVVRPPKTVGDLVRRRIRVATGNVEASTAGLQSQEARTTWSTVVGVGLTRPTLFLKAPVFLGVALVARFLSRRAVRAGDFTTWQRDESSRA